MKKKFTMLFAALLAFVGVAKAQVTSLEQLSNDTKYVLATKRCFFIVDAEGTVLQTSTRNGGATFDANDANQQFQIINNEGTYYLFSVGASKYVNKDGSLSETATDALTLTDESNSRPNYPWKMCLGGNGLNTQISGQDPNGIMINGWTTADDGNCFAIRNVEEYNLSTEYYYQIRNIAYPRMLAANATNATSISTNSTADLNQLWAFEQGDNGTFYLRNAGQEKYLVAATANNTAWTVAEEGGTAFNVKVQNPGILSYYLHNAAESDLLNCAHDANWGTDAQVVRWYASAEASQWYLEKTNILTTATEISFTYSFVYEGEEKYSQDCIAIVGEEYPAITAAFPFGVSAVKPEGKVTDDKDGAKVTIDLSVNLPFGYAKTTAPIDENWVSWYYIKNKNLYYLHHDEGLNHIPLSDNEKVVDAENKDAYSWAFVGDPFTGFQLVNKAAGIGMILTSSTTIEGDGANTFPTVGVINSSDKNSYWVLSASSHAENGFFMEQQGHTSHKMNNRGSKLAYWTGGADAGSTFTVELRDDSEELVALVASATELLSALGEGTTVGCVTADSKAVINAAIAEANTAIETKTGINAAQAALNAAIAAIETIQPEAGKFYTIASAMPNTDSRSGQSIYVNENGGMQFSNEEGASKLFQFVSAGEGKFYLYNVENGSYLNTAKGHNGGQAEAKAFATDGAKAVIITNMGRSNAVKIVPEGGAMLHAQDAGSTVVAWNNDDNAGASAWTIAEVEVADRAETFQHTLTVTEAGWATLVLGYNTTIPAGVKAYAVSSIAEGKAVLAEVADVLPAHTPVLIEAEAADYVFNYTDDEATVASNLLAGSVFNTYVAPVEGTTNYVLSNNNDVVALYKKTTTNDAGKIVFAAKKAYLPVETATEGAPAMFAFSRGGEDEDTTGIDQLINNGEVVIYDLAGRRVEKMEKGIYIVNGKKVVK